MWKVIKEIPKIEINENGEIRDAYTKKLRTQYSTSLGYKQLRIQINHKTYYYYIHRLVYETFVGDIPDDKEINHIDGDPSNNNIDNLELVTHQENCLHRSTLDNNSTRKVEVKYPDGTIKQFNSRVECAKYYQVDESSIRDYIGAKCTKRRKIQAEFYYI